LDLSGKNLALCWSEQSESLEGSHASKYKIILNPKNKLLSVRSFRKKIESLDALKPLISNFAVRAGEKLRHEKQKCSQVSVFISTSRFGKQLKHQGFNSFRFSHPNNDTRSILMGANTALNKAFKEGYPYAKAGILLSQFSCPNSGSKISF
jgi:DNA polymerase V